MEIADFLSPVNETLLNDPLVQSPKSMRHFISIYKDTLPDLGGVHLALIGLKEDRGSEFNQGCAGAADEVRKHLYRLIKPRYDLKIADLGNLEPGASLNDTYFAIQQITSYLLEQKVKPIFIGGSTDLAYALYKGYEGHTFNLNLSCIDARMPLASKGTETGVTSYLSRIVLHEPNYLFNISQIGYQSYFVEPESLDTFNRMRFDYHRLGAIRSQLTEVEPLVRNADMMVFNMSAIRSADAPGNRNATPNGFYGDEACQITRYAGMSNELSSIGFFEMNPEEDRNGQTAQLLSQMIWYFIDGYYNRKNDYPTIDSADFIVYRISFKNSDHEILFYKSKKSDRWWMEVPYPVEKSNKKGKYLVPCSYEDYQTACKDDLPDRWLKTYEKLL